MNRAGIKSHKVCVIVNNSAIGDTVCTLPAILSLHRDDALAHVCCSPQMAEIYREFIPESLITLMDVNKQEIVAGKDLVVRHSYVQFVTTMQTHLVDYASMVLADTILKDRSYPQVAPRKQSFVKGPYVVIGTNHTSELKKFPKETVQAITAEITKLGLTPVWVGKKYKCQMKAHYWVDIEDDGLGEPDDSVVDLREKTSLSDLLDLCYNAELVVGMDSGIIHVAGLTPTKIVAGYSHKDPWYLMPIRDNELGKNVFPVYPPETSCRWCMTCTRVPDFYYTTCARGDLECIQNMTPDMFIEQIRKALTVELVGGLNG